MARVTDYAVVEARPDGEQHIAMLHCHVRFVSPVHAEHPEELAIGRRVGAKSHQGVRAGKTQRAHELREFIGRTAQDNAPAGVDHRALGLGKELYRLLDLPGVALDHRVVRAHRNRLGIVKFRLGRRHVLRNVHHDRARAAGRRNIESLLHGDREILHVLHQEVMLDARPRDTDRVAFLERVLANRVRRHLAGDDDEGDRIHVGSGNAGDGIGHARPGRHQRDPYLVG